MAEAAIGYKDGMLYIFGTTEREIGGEGCDQEGAEAVHIVVVEEMGILEEKLKCRLEINSQPISL